MYKPHWNKFHYLKKLLNESESEYLVWFDHDIVIKNQNIELYDIIKKYNFHESNELFMMSSDPASKYPFNTGVIIVKNKKESLKIVDLFFEIRNNPKKFPMLQKFGGYDFDNGFQDTRVMLAYYEENKKNKKNILSVPHRVLQSFYGQKYYYEKGDFCGHVAGPQGNKLIEKLKMLKNL